MTAVLRTDQASDNAAPCPISRGSDLITVLEETWEKSKEVCEREEKKTTFRAPGANC